MAANEPRGTKAKPSRAAIFDFSTLGTLRHLLLRRAGSLTRPANRLTLTIAASCPARESIEHLAQHLQAAA